MSDTSEQVSDTLSEVVRHLTIMVKIIEIFSSIQGEGLRIGERQIFIRFHGCNLRCKFCDVDRKRGPVELGVKKLIDRVDKLNTDNIHNTIALTGGEPLLHTSFLERALPRLKDRGFKIYLETNGTLHKELGRLIEHIDTIAVDIKLPSVSKNRPCWQEHYEFLKTAFQKEFFVKVVVSKWTDLDEFDRAIELMKETSFDIPFIIQPETKKDSCRLKIAPDRLLRLQERALKSLNNVLVIPQAHKMLGIR